MQWQQQYDSIARTMVQRIRKSAAVVEHKIWVITSRKGAICEAQHSLRRLAMTRTPLYGRRFNHQSARVCLNAICIPARLLFSFDCIGSVAHAMKFSNCVT